MPAQGDSNGREAPTLQQVKPLTFALHFKGNPDAANDVREELSQRGWEELPPEELGSAELVWAKYTISALSLDQHTNHFPTGWGSLTTKTGLTNSLTRLVRASKNKLSVDSFWPRCHNLWNDAGIASFSEDFVISGAVAALRPFAEGEDECDLAEVEAACAVLRARFSHNVPQADRSYLRKHSADSEKLRKQACILLKAAAGRTRAERTQSRLNRRNIWILKPGNLSRGRGIWVSSDEAQIRKQCHGRDGTRWVAQKYIENPLVMDGKKFDIRQWCMCTCIQPLTVWFFSKCYLRFCCVDYDPSDLNNQFSHLTNNSIQKNCDDFDEADSGAMGHSDDFAAWLQAETGTDVWTDKIQPAMRKSVVLALKAAQLHGAPERLGTFEIFGFDFMIDEDYNAWLIEANLSPDLSHSTPVTAELVPEMIADTMKVIVDGVETGLKSCLDSDSEQAEGDSDEDESTASEDEDSDESMSTAESVESVESADSLGSWCSYKRPEECRMEGNAHNGAPTGRWVCIHRGKKKGWSFDDFLSREQEFINEKHDHLQHLAAEEEHSLLTPPPAQLVSPRRRFPPKRLEEQEKPQKPQKPPVAVKPPKHEQDVLNAILKDLGLEQDTPDQAQTGSDPVVQVPAVRVPRLLPPKLWEERLAAPPPMRRQKRGFHESGPKRGTWVLSPPPALKPSMNLQKPTELTRIGPGWLKEQPKDMKDSSRPQRHLLRMPLPTDAITPLHIPGHNPRAPPSLTHRARSIKFQALSPRYASPRYDNAIHRQASAKVFNLVDAIRDLHRPGPTSRLPFPVNSNRY